MPTRSSKATQLHHCRPEPIRPPSPSLNRRAWMASAPPSRACTTPVRTWTVRTPAARAGSAAASHCWQTSARNPRPPGLRSVSTSSPRSPYQLTPEAQASTRGPSRSPAMVRASSPVPFTRLSRISRLTLAVQRSAPLLLPARCTTASARAKAPASMVPPAGSQWAAPCPGLGERVKRMTSWPSADSLETRAVPINPVEPVTATRMSSSSLRCFAPDGSGLALALRRRAVADATEQVAGELQADHALAERLRQRLRQPLGAVQHDHLVDRAERLGGRLHDRRPVLRELLADDRVLVLGQRVGPGLDGVGLGQTARAS